MSKQCRVLKGGYCETTQGYSSSHKANDIVGKGYTLDYIIAHTDGTVNFYQDGRYNDHNTRGNDTYGNCIKINHGNGYETLYAHMEKGLKVKNGQYVKKGQIIGYMGNSGNSYGGHLHFEVRKNGVLIDPSSYLNKDLFTVISLPKAVNENKKIDQVKVICGKDTLRCRTGHSTNSSIIGAINPGFYNIVSTYKGKDYVWYEVEKGKWIAGVDGCVRFIAKEETKVELPKAEPPKEEPKEEVKKEETKEEPKKDDNKPKEEDNIKIPDKPKKDDIKDNKPNNNEIPNYYDKKDNSLLWLIDTIINIIKKIFTYKRKK